MPRKRDAVSDDPITGRQPRKLDRRALGTDRRASKRRTGDKLTARLREVNANAKPMRWAFYYACRYLVANGPQPADMVGAVVWKGKKRGKTTSMGGGGDYAAQMLLGRMKKAGLVQHAKSEGSTRWEVTPLGRAEAAK